MNDIPSNLNELCRTCLIKSNKMTSLETSSIGPSLLDKLSTFLNTKITVTINNLPTLICNICEIKLNSAYEFHDLCVKSNQRLVTYLKNEEHFINKEVTDNQVKAPPYYCYGKESIPQYKYSNSSNENYNGSTEIKCLKEEIYDEGNLENESACPIDVLKNDDNCNIVSVNYGKKKRSYQNKGDVDKLKNLCSLCGKTFRFKSRLKAHMRTHTGEQPYKCRFCDKLAKSRTAIVSHERTHTGDKPYSCEICGKTFRQSSVLKTHLRIHNGRTEECKICHKKFCRPTELKLHLRQHTGETPYECENCNKSFRQKSHLEEHRRIHNNVKTFKCEYCEKSFRHLGTLKAHTQIHLGQKLFKCTECPYACRQSYSLTRHMVQHSSDKSKTEDTFVCNICSKAFNTAAHFVAHYNRYHGPLKAEELPKGLALLASIASDVEEIKRNAGDKLEATETS